MPPHTRNKRRYHLRLQYREGMTAAEPRRLRADAARNRRRLIEAAEQVFATRGLDATLDDIARQAGVNVATAYRHFASKHELATAFLQHTLDRAAALARQAAADDDPWAGLTHFLGKAVELMSSNRGLADALTHGHDSEWFDDQLSDLITGPLRRLITRGQEAGAVRPDVDATDFAFILKMLGSLTDPAKSHSPELAGRYLSLVLAGLRPSETPLEGSPPTDAELRAVIGHKD
jgi:AcrR family transcriptional regulator